MAHQVIKYRLTAEGTIPEFLCLEDDSVGGVYGTYPTGADAQPSPRDLVQVGISCDGATGDFEVIASQADLETYLTSISSDWHDYPNPTEEDPGATKTFDPAAEASWVWSRLDALNAAV